MKRTGVVWAVSILVTLNAAAALWQIITEFTSLSKQFGVIWLTQPYFLMDIILGVAILCSTLLMLFRFFMLRRDALPWLYISFGLSAIVNVVDHKYIWAVIIVLVGWALADYIRKKRVGNDFLFN